MIRRFLSCFARLQKVSPQPDVVFDVQSTDSVRVATDFLQPQLASGQVCLKSVFLASTNVLVNSHNQRLLNLFPGEIIELRSSDAPEGVGIESLAVEYLNTENPPQFPPHNLVVKVGAPVVLLRNLRSVRVSNGQRGIVTAVSPNRRIVTVCVDRRVVMLPRIDFMIPLSNYPGCSIRRRQFPLKLGFALTVHKSQGQTLDREVFDTMHPLNPCPRSILRGL